VEAVFDASASSSLGEWQRERLLYRLGPRITAVAQDARSQARNRELALERLAQRIATALSVPRSRTPTLPTAASRRERLQEKRRRSERKAARRRPEAEPE
jgi:ribosome-associated protein